MDDGGMQKVMAGQMMQPMFPVPMAAMRSTIEFHDFRAGEEVNLSKKTKIKTIH